MNRRFILPGLTTFFVLIGGFCSFFVVKSQVQFASLNYIFFALAAVCAGIGLLARKKEKAAAAYVSYVALSAAAFGTWAVVSSAVSGRFASTIMGMSTSLVGLGALVCFGLIAWYATSARDEFLRILGYISPVLLLVTAMYGLLGSPVANAEGTTIDALHLGFANSSELALFYVLLVPFALMRGVRFLKNDQAERLVRYGVVALTMVALWMNAMRMAFIVVVLIALYYALCEFLPQRAMRRRVVGAALLVFACAGAALTYGAMQGGIGASFLSIRGQLWRAAGSEIAKRPLTGYGADGFFGATATIAKPANWWGGNALHLTDSTTDPHNFLVLLTVSFGLIGLALFCALAAMWFMRSLGAQASLESREKKPVHGFFSAPMVATAAGFLTLLTMPTTVNLLPLLALCAGSSLIVPTAQQRIELRGSWMSIATSVAITLGLCATIITGADAMTRFSFGGVSYLQGPAFDRALSAQTLFGWDPFIAHELNVAYAYSGAKGQEQAREDAIMVARNSARPTLLDSTNPYYRLMYLNVLYKSGQLKTALSLMRAETTPDALRLALLKQAARDFPAQADIDIELAISAADAKETALVKEAAARVRALGDYAEAIWQAPLASIDAYLKSEER